VEMKSITVIHCILNDGHICGDEIDYCNSLQIEEIGYDTLVIEFK
jgi:hypothetical protein